MKAITKKVYGGPEVLQLEEVAKPVVKDHHILVKVMANSANPADWHILRGKPFFARLSFGLFKPKKPILGADFAGIVEEVGNSVENYKMGDHVFGEMLDGGAFAEYLCVPVNACAKMPENVGFSAMAGVPIAGLTAYQALITHGKIKEGESVLINGASGGVGHFAVQIAKAYGAHVTGVCSSRNIDFITSIGADDTLAYDEENIHEHNDNYDVIIDTHGNLSHSDYKRMGKRGVMVGYTTMAHMLSVLLKKVFSKFPLIQFTAEANTHDLEILASLVREGKMKVHIEKTYSHTEIPEAIVHIEKMRTRGKVGMEWER
ncbi:NADPH:quinone reductase-like Zn-dependent oxidoreductase [Maribacter caenipelagi]|uniref:NADPH:quinone reductase-like Zn-dependent oxidoreductase n=1 Tax=Maribacter caenipelagi TaxID=1447781 RepID=A0A4R7D7R9_9FLAO|nr:NAD(P)-dependent alcohol dehydrogenase [Maribacter caenipelagi]TDS15046.1 NADPH:quinone reductase-like Zn-dependent oxidoreductase [Maribacter caenipelagi]